jgi:mannose-6-phosphate isomerase-like protein (cupin superfamily)
MTVWRARSACCVLETWPAFRGGRIHQQPLSAVYPTYAIEQLRVLLIHSSTTVVLATASADWTRSIFHTPGAGITFKSPTKTMPSHRYRPVARGARPWIITGRDLVVFATGMGMGWLAVALFQKGGGMITTSHSRTTPPSVPTTTSRQRMHSATSTVTRLETVLPRQSSAHAGIYKQQLIEEFSVHPLLAGISVATLRRGQSIPRHVHATMHEFFFVLQGNLSIAVEESSSLDLSSLDPTTSAATTTTTRRYECGVDCLFHAVPGEPHSFAVPHNATNDVQVLLVQLLSQ